MAGSGEAGFQFQVSSFKLGGVWPRSATNPSAEPLRGSLKSIPSIVTDTASQTQVEQHSRAGSMIPVQLSGSPQASKHHDAYEGLQPPCPFVLQLKIRAFGLIRRTPEGFDDSFCSNKAALHLV